MFSLTRSLGLGFLRVAFLSVGEVISSLVDFYHSAELANLILSFLSMAQVTYLRMDTSMVFSSLCVRCLFGICDIYNDIEGEYLEKVSYPS